MLTQQESTPSKSGQDAMYPFLPTKDFSGEMAIQPYKQYISWNHVVYYILGELHADLFSRHASPLEVCVFVAVEERGEDVISDEICRRCNGKQQRRRRGGLSV